MGEEPREDKTNGCSARDHPGCVKGKKGDEGEIGDALKKVLVRVPIAVRQKKG